MIELATLDRDSPVVRGGINRDADKLLQVLLESEDYRGAPVISVFIVEPQARPIHEAVLDACKRGPVMHGQIQVSSVGRLLDRNFLIADERTADESEVHYHVHFPAPVTLSVVEAWLTCFDHPVPNPAKNRRS